MKKLLILLLFIPLVFFGQDLDVTSEINVRNYFDENGSESIEGIYLMSALGENQHKVTVIKENEFTYNAYVTENLGGSAKNGTLRAIFKSTMNPSLFEVQWQNKRKSYRKNSVAVVEQSLIKFNLGGVDILMLKTYPAASNKKTKTREWVGNGSGVIISKSGHIATNFHVIEDAEGIEVEFILDEETQKFNAGVVQVDKVNDLAIIKIIDVNFDGLDEPPYNFKTRSSDVGTKVYAFGYPMALSLMGKEIKITDGIISSKSGFQGDITTYQITAPIQGGNSGGPLFDDRGNLLGINSSGINKEIADNVGYTIKSNYILNLIDVLPESIDLPSNTKLESLPLTEQIKEISKYVVLIKVKWKN